MKNAFPLALTLVIAACGQPTSPLVNETESATPASDAPVENIAVPAQPAAAPTPEKIPAKFRGIWAEGRAACAQLSHPSRLIISESVIRYPSFVLVGESVDLPTDSSIAIKGQNQRTGAPAEAHFSIDVTGLILTDEAGGGTVREKCG